MTIDEMGAFLHALVDTFDFNRVGADQSLGRDIAMKVVENIQERAHGEPGRGADEQWKENEEKYAKWKAKRYNLSEQSPNVRTGQMLSQKSLYGQTRIEPELITMVYGTDEPPKDTKTGVKPTKADELVTDSQKAYYAHTGQSEHKIKRPFYEVTEADGIAVRELAEAALNEHIKEANSLL